MDSTNQELLLIAQDIRRLLIALLLRKGASQADVAKALGVNQATVSRLVSAVRTDKTTNKKRK